MTKRITDAASAIEVLRGLVPDIRIEGEGEAAVAVVEEVCGRCGGSGRYSRCELHGTDCFDCTVVRRPSRWTARKPVVAYARKMRTRANAQAKRDAQRAAWEAEAAARAALRAEQEAARAAEREARYAAMRAASKFVGTVGERREFTLQIKVVREMPSNYSRFQTNALYITRDPEGNVVKYFSSRVLPGWEQGAEVRCIATVKAHEEYKSEKQTVITRAKVISDTSENAGNPAQAE